MNMDTAIELVGGAPRWRSEADLSTGEFIEMIFWQPPRRSRRKSLFIVRRSVHNLDHILLDNMGFVWYMVG